VVKSQFSPAWVRRAGYFLVCTILLSFQSLSSPFAFRTQSGEIPLPTPKSHYQQFKPGMSGLPVLAELLKGVDPTTLELVANFARASGLPNGADPADLKNLQELIKASGLLDKPLIPREQAVALVRQTNWTQWKPQILEFFVHQSQVLDLIPEKWGTIWKPIVHDALLNFLAHLPDDRLLDKLVGLAYLPQGTSRGDYLVEFVSRAPSLQKMGQILARNPDLAGDYRDALQRLENSIHTMSRDELVQFVVEDVGKEEIEQYQVQFADEILAEASVGATIRSSYVVPGSSGRRESICKVVKPYVLVYLPQDLQIIDGLAAFFEKEHDFYQLGSIPLVEIFQEIRKSLSDEIKIVDEQQNFMRAREYYKGNKEVTIPEILPISTQHVTFMDFIHGEKITSAFEAHPKERAIMAKRLVDVLTFDPIWGPGNVTIFHGDPHAGNVFHVTNDPQSPYRIALLDWGLYGQFTREERLALSQLILGVRLRDAKRLKKYSGELFEQGLANSPEMKQRVDAIIDDFARSSGQMSTFEGLQALLFTLVEEGYQTKYSLNLFVKSQVTIAGILVELDPTLKQDEYLEHRLTGLVKRELPKRFLNTIWFPGWNSHGYQSLLSNADVVAVRKKPARTVQSKAPAAQAGAVPTPTAP
jgi:ubiquinone biosynthesis protein